MVPWLQWYMYFFQERTSFSIYSKNTCHSLQPEHSQTLKLLYAMLYVWSYQASPLKDVSFSVYSVHRQHDCTIISRKREGQNSHVQLMTVYKTYWFQALEDLKDATWHPSLYKLRIQEQWIEGDRLVWNHFGTEGPRTTNNIKAMHGKLKRNVQHTHPNIFTIIQTFKKTQNSNDINIILKRSHGNVRPRAKKNININQRLAMMKTKQNSCAK